MNLELKDIDFSFSLKTVLNKLNISFNEGQIHGLLGENGAGKSTTANIICGELKPSAGTILIDKKPVTFNSPKDAIASGICYVHQRPQLCENITVYENLLLGLTKNQKKNISELSSQIIPTIKLSTPLYNITSDYRFFISLTGALLKNPKILILDEPSALLNEIQIKFLYDTLKNLAKEGMNIIVITHSRLESEKYCDDVFILEKQADSNLIYNSKTSDIIHQKNSSLEMQWSNISCRTRNHIPIKNLTFSTKKQNITLISGPAEQGLAQLEDIICGMNTFKCSGTFTVKTENSTIEYNLAKNFNTNKLRYKSGIKTGIIPTNKKLRGANPELTINECLSFHQPYMTPEEIIAKSNINIQPSEKVKNLSGGMLQRLLINRELACKPDLLILCNPLQGLDSSSSSQLIRSIQQLAQDNTAILILSNSVFPEEICSTVYHLNKGEFKNV